MPRFKIRNVVRALYFLIVVYTVYYIRVERWSSNTGLEYGGHAGPAINILDHVNMFIGTKNGGEARSIDHRRGIYSRSIHVGHAFPGASLPYG
jgi:hypothetical protein